jgi:hypothetical protein
MAKHYSSNTVSVSHWCNKCSKHTQHRIDNHRLGPCLECVARLEQMRQRKPGRVRQKGLFEQD